MSSSDTEEEDYEVEAVIDSRQRKGVTQYKVKWVGYPEPTWLDEEHCEGCQDRIEEFKKKNAVKEEIKTEAETSRPSRRGAPTPVEKEAKDKTNEASSSARGRGRPRLVSSSDGSITPKLKKKKPEPEPGAARTRPRPSPVDKKKGTVAGPGRPRRSPVEQPPRPESGAARSRPRPSPARKEIKKIPKEETPDEEIQEVKVVPKKSESSPRSSARSDKIVNTTAIDTTVSKRRSAAPSQLKEASDSEDDDQPMTSTRAIRKKRSSSSSSEEGSPVRKSTRETSKKDYEEKKESSDEERDKDDTEATDPAQNKPAFEVEEIVNDRRFRGRKQYHVKWRECNTLMWEEIDDLDCPELVAAYEKKKTEKPRGGDSSPRRIGRIVVRHPILNEPKAKSKTPPPSKNQSESSTKTPANKEEKKKDSDYVVPARNISFKNETPLSARPHRIAAPTTLKDVLDSDDELTSSKTTPSKPSTLAAKTTVTSAPVVTASPIIIRSNITPAETAKKTSRPVRVLDDMRPLAQSTPKKRGRGRPAKGSSAHKSLLDSDYSDSDSDIEIMGSTRKKRRSGRSGNNLAFSSDEDEEETPVMTPKKEANIRVLKELLAGKPKVVKVDEIGEMMVWRTGAYAKWLKTKGKNSQFDLRETNEYFMGYEVERVLAYATSAIKSFVIVKVTPRHAARSGVEHTCFAVDTRLASRVFSQAFCEFTNRLALVSIGEAEEEMVDSDN